MKKTRKLTVTAIFSAMAIVLMLFLDFSLPFLPSYLKVDFGELPALIVSFAAGPVYGVAVCFIKNLMSMPKTITMGAGELANFIIGASFVFTAGMVYSKCKSKKGAVIGVIAGTLVMTLFSVLANVFITYPAYINLAGMPKEVIVGMYTALCPVADTLFKGILIFNTPLTFVKGVINSLITIVIYKKLSPIIKGTAR